MAESESTSVAHSKGLSSMAAKLILEGFNFLINLSPLLQIAIS
jgi:hypothetical protein